jgi:hypothetical protein
MRIGVSCPNLAIHILWEAGIDSGHGIKPARRITNKTKAPSQMETIPATHLYTREFPRVVSSLFLYTSSHNRNPVEFVQPLVDLFEGT